MFTWAEQDQVADRIVANCRYGSEELHLLHGPLGAGKSTILRKVSDRSLEEGLVPILVSPPAGDLDSACSAFVQLAKQLKDRHIINGSYQEALLPDRPWEHKLRLVDHALETARDKVVLLCDEPDRWLPNQGRGSIEIPESARFVHWIKSEVRCRRVLTGNYGVQAKAQIETTPHVDDCFRLLDTLALEQQKPRVLQLRRLSIGHLRCSLGSVKLILALLRLQRVEEVAESLKDSPVRMKTLIASLLSLLELTPRYTALRRSLIRLAHCRIPIPMTLFQSFLADCPSREYRTVKSYLVDRTSMGYSLHPGIRSLVLARSKQNENPEHFSLWRLHSSEYRSLYDQIFHAIAGEKCFGESEVDSLHYQLLGRSDLPNKFDNRLKFVEQLHSIGRKTSHLFHDRERAVQIYELSLKITNHPYSHHYLAYNLDWLADSPEKVEYHYQTAIFLRPEHPWWQSRWISYLVTRGRVPEAKEAWRTANSVIVNAWTSKQSWLYKGLHRWVARWLLHWGEIEFAGEVLSQVPPDLLASDPSFVALNELLVALRAAEEGIAVFPLHIKPSSWWVAGGHTGLPKEVEGCALVVWKAARVDCVDVEGQCVYLSAAQKPAEGEGIEVEDLDLTRAELESTAQGFVWDDLREGRFLELGYYSHAALPQAIRLHTVEFYSDPDLAPLKPPPDRWYHRAISSAWARHES